MKIYVSLIAILILIITFLSACAPEKQLPQPEVKSVPAVVETRPGWQVEWEQLTADAKKEGRIVLYGAYGLADARETFIKTLKSRFDLDLEMTVARGPQLAQKIIMERRAGLYNADIYLGGATDFVAYLFPEKLLDPIEPYIILPEVKDPNKWIGGKLPIWDSERRVFSSLAQISTRTAINTSFVRPDEITSYQDILDPKWKGKIVLSDPTTTGSGSSWAWLAALIKGQDYIRDLVKQEPVITRDSRLLSEWLAKDKYYIGLGIDSGATKSFIDAGAHLYLVPSFKEGSELRGSSGHVSIINRAAHPKAAKVFLNWILSKEGQTMYSKANGVASRRIDVPTSHLESWQIPDPKVSYISRETESALQEELKMLEIFKETFAPLLKQ